MKKRIWLIGGTSESKTIAIAIAKRGWPCTISVTTKRAIALYPKTPHLKIIARAIESELIGKFLVREQIIAIVDATHPHAVNISRGAIAAANALKIPYLRFDREEIPGSLGDLKKEKAIQLDSFDTLLAGNYLLGKRVLLIVGCKILPRFQVWQSRSTLFARILPYPESLEIALDSGFSPDRIVAIRPPVSLELEKALWQQWQISLIVNKANGRVGGEDIKRVVASQLNVPSITIARPKVNYPQQTYNLDEVLSFCAARVATASIIN
ncbi:MAG: cobalt-precorrin-6A reductase [Prochloraceae cyanobacterium]